MNSCPVVAVRSLSILPPLSDPYPLALFRGDNCNMLLIQKINKAMKLRLVGV